MKKSTFLAFIWIRGRLWKKNTKVKYVFHVLIKYAMEVLKELRSGNITIVKCEKYRKSKTNTNNNLKKYIAEMKLREYKNDY